VFERPPAVVDRDAGPSIVATIAEHARAAGPSIVKWLAIAAALAVAIAGAWLGLPYLRSALTSFEKPAPVAASATRTPTPKTATAATGELHVTSNPAGAHVLLDGKDRGVTPLTLTGVGPGSHDVRLTSSSGSVRRTVTLDAGESVDVDESIFPGWVAVLAPFEVQVAENGHALRPDERDQILLAPGVHDLRLTNAALNYVTVQQVEVKPGATTPVRVTPPSSTLTVTSADASEVWLDGARIGVTPLTAAPAPLGTHEVVLKRTGAPDRRFTLTIGTTPVTLNADAGR